MDEMYIAAKTGDIILIINKKDIPLIGKENALLVNCVQVDLGALRIYPASKLEEQLKFNSWEETTEKERAALLQFLNTKFSDSDIYNNIMIPLIEGAAPERDTA